MKPLRVLIADDEPLLLDEMKALPWSELESTVVGIAMNGEQAFELSKTCVPDVIITDITMPRMTGLELLKRVKEIHPSTQVIVLTCHGEFTYAQTALRFGATDYVMKVDLCTETLQSALDKARAQLVKEQSLEIAMREEAELGRIKHLSAWLTKSEHEGVIADELKDNLPVPCIPACIRIAIPTRHQILVSRLLSRLLREIGERVSTPPIAPPISAQDTGLFFPGLFGVRKCAEELRWLISELETQLASELPFISDPWFIVGYVGQPCARADLLPSALSAISNWQNASFYTANHEVFIGLPKPTNALTPELFAVAQQQMLRFEAAPEELSRFLKNDFRVFAEQHRVKPDHLKHLLLTWVARWRRDTDELESSSTIYEGILTAATLDHLLQVVSRCVGSDSAPGQGNEYRIEVRKAIGVILRDLSSPITLGAIAEKVNLSPPYFSQVFKAETGDSFNHFVNRARVNLARELLQSGTSKVYEVAEQVGIPNYRYFCDVFRKYTGVSPTEYRRSTP